MLLCNRKLPLMLLSDSLTFFVYSGSLNSFLFKFLHILLHFPYLCIKLNGSHVLFHVTPFKSNSFGKQVL
uniref:Uncharacterized protein n=1 Tax=Arundo donax TaxID=35708 RepID=A0A0A9CN78_ARUDO